MTFADAGHNSSLSNYPSLSDYYHEINNIRTELTNVVLAASCTHFVTHSGDSLRSFSYVA
jgi:hypothetical protein